jgi:hypothetical protein
VPADIPCLELCIPVSGLLCMPLSVLPSVLVPLCPINAHFCINLDQILVQNLFPPNLLFLSPSHPSTKFHPSLLCVWGQIPSRIEIHDLYVDGYKANLISALIGFTIIPTLQEDGGAFCEVRQRFILTVASAHRRINGSRCNVQVIKIC